MSCEDLEVRSDNLKKPCIYVRCAVRHTAQAAAESCGGRGLRVTVRCKDCFVGQELLPNALLYGLRVDTWLYDLVATVCEHRIYSRVPGISLHTRYSRAGISCSPVPSGMAHGLPLCLLAVTHSSRHVCLSTHSGSTNSRQQSTKPCDCSPYSATICHANR